MPPANPADPIRDAVIRRAAELGLTAYAIARDSGGAVNEDTVRAYLTGRKDMTGRRLGAVLRVLGLEVRKGK